MSYTEARGYIICAIVTIYAGFIFVGFTKYESQKYNQTVYDDSSAEPVNGPLAQPSVVNVEPMPFHKVIPAIAPKRAATPLVPAMAYGSVGRRIG